MPGISSASASEALSSIGQPARVVHLFVADSSGVASAPLAEQVRRSLLDFRAAGIAVVVNTSIPQIVSVQLKLQFLAGADTTLIGELARAAVVEHLNSLPVNGTLLRASLFQVLQRFAPNGLIVSDQSVAAPTGDVVPTPGQTIRTRLENVTLI